MKTIRIDHDSHAMVYSAETGEYLGQYQDNMLGDSLHDLNAIWIPAEIIDGKPCVNGEPVLPLEGHELNKHFMDTLDYALTSHGWDRARQGEGT